MQSGLKQRPWKAILGRKEIVGLVEVEKAIHQWRSLTPLFILAPTESSYRTVLEFQQFITMVQGPFLKRSRLVILYSLFLVMSALFVLSQAEGVVMISQRAGLVLASSLLLSYLCLDYWLVKRHLPHLVDRIRLLLWLRVSMGKSFCILLLLLLLLGLGQGYLQLEMRGAASLAMQYGVIYFLLDQMEYSWRILTGPLIHQNLLHWFINSFLLLLIGPLVWGIGHWRSLFIFFIGNFCGIASAYTALYFELHSTFGYLGFSAGVYALWGYAILYALKYRAVCPAYLAFTLGTIISALSIVNLAMLPLVTTILHAAGFLWGGLLALLLPASLRSDLFYKSCRLSFT